MRHLTIISTLIYFLTLTACGQTETILTDCFKKKEQNLILTALSHFDNALRVYYKDDTLTTSYKKFLDDFSQQKLEMRFFINRYSYETIKEIEKTKTLSSFWKHTVDTTKTVIVDTESQAFTCTTQMNSTNPRIKECYDAMTVD